MCLGNPNAAPPEINALGQKMTPEMREQLYGHPDNTWKWDWGTTSFHGEKGSFGGVADPAAALSAWETGTPEGSLKTLDPMKAIEDASRMSGVAERAAAGEGIGGLFGFGRYAGKLPDFGVPALPPINLNAPKGK